MESENSIAPAVKDSDSKKAKKIRRRTGKICASEISDKRTFNLFRRFQGRLRGVWRRAHGRTQYFDWRNEDFARISGKQGGKAVSARTVERQFPRYQRWEDEFVFQKIMAVRSGAPKGTKPTWCVRVTLAGGVRADVPGATIRDRLQAWAAAYIAKAGRARLDRAAIIKFAHTTALPLVAVESVWLRMEKFGGFKCRWRGEGRGRRLLVEDGKRWAEICAERAARVKSGKFETTDPQTSPPVSISSGNERIKNSGLTPDGPEETARAAPANATAKGDATRETHPPPEPGGYEHASKHRWQPGSGPLRIGNRFVSGRKLRNLSVWLAAARLKFAHVSRERVGWVFCYAQKFAEEALRAGYRAEAIERAYACGVDRSHEDALDKDRLPEGGYAAVRPPSAAVHYAWVKLRGDDPRPPAELWAEFFAAPRRGRLEPRGPAAKVAGVGIRARREETGAQRAEKLAVLREQIQAAAAARKPREEFSAAEQSLNVGELAAYLKTQCGMTMANFSAMNYSMKKGFIQRAAAWSQADKPAKPQLPGDKFMDR